MRRFLAVLTITALLPGTASADEKATLPKVKHMIDTHIHLYDTRREEGVPWPPPDDEVLYKPHLPDEFKKVSKPTGLTGVVIVEASDRLEDNRWVLDLVKDDDYYVALVGNIDVYRDDFRKQLKKLRKDPRFVGVRARGAKPIDFTDKKVLKNLRLLAKHGLSVDVLVNGGGVEAVKMIDKLAREVPELRIVIDHVIGYDFDGKKANPEWVAAVEKLGENKNVWCKISGLYQRSIPQPAPKDINHYRDVLDVLWKNLGAKRLVYGSNWPCTKKSGDYASYVQLVNGYFADKGHEARERYFWKNAAEAYKLPLE